MSVLYSSEGGENSNSKNSVTLTYSPDSKKKNSASLSKLSKTSQNNTVNTVNTINTIVNNPLITDHTNKTSNTHNTKNSKNSKNSLSNNSSSNKSEINIKDVITKRKILIQKQKEKENMIPINKGINAKNGIKMRLENLSEITNQVLNKNLHLESSDELMDIVSEYENISKSGMNNMNNLNNVKITNITNIILGPKSFDIKTQNKDMMLRDVKALHVITQKALSTHSKHNPIDSVDDERRSFFNFHNLSSKKALFIDDNSDLPQGIGKDLSKGSVDKENISNSFTFSNNSEFVNRQKQIINIININNNYNIGSINMPQIENKTKTTNINNNYYSLGQNPNFNKSFRTMSINNYKKNISHIPEHCNTNNCDTPNNETSRSNATNKILRKLIPRNSNSNSTLKEYMTAMNNNNSSGNLNMINPHLNNKSIKDIIKSVKKDNGKGKFVNLANK